MPKFCYRHPKVQTAVSCGKCDRPICTRCMVSGPAGMRCPECASLRGTTLYKISAGRLALTLLVGLFAGVFGATIIAMVSFFVFFLGPLYGTAVAEVVLRASGRKRGPLVDAIGVGSILIGALVVFGPSVLGLLGVFHAGAPQVGSLGLIWSLSLMRIMWPVIGFALAIPSCLYRLRHL